jgi:hypothetical protein
MHVMSQIRSDHKHRPSVVACWVVLYLTLGLSQGCAGPNPLRRTDGTSPVTDKLPFHTDTVHASGGDSSSLAVPSDPRLGSGVPFRARSHQRVLPSGTLLTVQLTRTLSAAKVRAGDRFAAAVAAPITIDGETLVDRGVAVTGRIESTESETDQVRALGYFRLTLNAITVAGKLVPLQTSSLFAPGTTRSSNLSRSNSIRVQKGHRLTFRLIAPVTLDDSATTANRKFSGSTSE